MNAVSTRTIALLIALYCAGLGAAGQFAKISVTFTNLGALYPDAGASLGFLVSLVSFTGIIFGLFAGLLVARFGPRRLLLAAMVLGAAMSFFQASLPGFLPMLASRLLEGVSHLIIVVAAPTLMAQISPVHTRGLVMTVWSTFFAVAFAIVAKFGVPLVEAQGLGALFIVHGGVMAVAWAALFMLLPQDRAASAHATLNMRFMLREHRAVYTSPFVFAPAAGWLFYTLTFVSLITIIPAYVPDEEAVFATSGMAAAGLVGALFTGFVLLRLASAVHVVWAGFITSALMVIAFSATGESWFAILLFACLGLVQGASFAAVPELNESAQEQTRANGAMAQMGNLGNMVGTPALLLVTLVFGIWGVTLFAATVYAAGLALHVLLALKRRAV